MKTGLQSLLVVPHTHSLGRGISFWLAHSRRVTQRQDSFNLLQQCSGVQACQKLQEEWWPCRWQSSNWVAESSSKECVCANKCGLTPREICWGMERESTAVPQCWMLSKQGLGFAASRAWSCWGYQQLVESYSREEVVQLEPEAIGSGWPGCSAKKGSLCPGNGTRAHKLPRRWEMQELQALESIYPPRVCPLVLQFSHSVPHNHQHSQCYLRHCWDPAT